MAEEKGFENLRKKYREIFGITPVIVVRSPGRINLIGEHTDYNDGFVFPAAIDKVIWLVASKNNKGLFRFYASDYNKSFEMKVSELSISDTPWANYLLGVAHQFNKSGCNIGGVDCVFGGNIPIGAGLSSSAAIETGFSLVLNQLFNCNASKLEQVRMAQKAEHEYAGVMCGIMDQFVIMHGKADCAIKLDCRSLEFDYANINLADIDIVLCDTNVKHTLASSEYNNRRNDCEFGVKILQKHNPDIIALRDVDLDFLNKYEHEFDKNVFKRCKYVVEEIGRVNHAFIALQQGNIQQLGDLMFRSHQGLKNDFEVSCNELDILEEIARSSKEVIGARMMGGGFGGCTINLVKKEGTKNFSRRISADYKKIRGMSPEIHIVKIADGTGLISI